MNDGAGRLSTPVRVAAAILGLYMGCGGLLLAVAAVSTNLWRAGLEAIAGLSIAFLFIRAAKSGWSPAWPD